MGGGSPKGDITLKVYKVKEVTRGRGGQKSQNGGDVIYERPLFINGNPPHKLIILLIMNRYKV